MLIGEGFAEIFILFMYEYHACFLREGLSAS